MSHVSLISRTLPRVCYGWLFISALLSTFWIGLGNTILWGTHTLHTSWAHSLHDTTLVTLPPSTPTTSSTEAQLLELTRAIHTLPDVTELHILSKADINALLRRWTPPWPDPLPGMVTFQYDGDLQTLERTIHHTLPSAVIVPPPPQTLTLLPLLKTLEKSALLMMAIFLVSGSMCFLTTFFMSLKVIKPLPHSSVTLLMHLGFSASRYARHYAYRIASTIIIGSMAGGVFLIILSHQMVSLLSSFLHLGASSTLWYAYPFSTWHFIEILIIPAGQALIGWCFSYLYMSRMIRFVL